MARNKSLITMQIPNNAPSKSVLKAVVTDSAGNKEVFYQQVNPGQPIQIPVIWYGSNGQVLLFLNGQAQAPQRLTATGTAGSPSVANSTSPS
jgi:serine/threonine-protein kinase